MFIPLNFRLQFFFKGYLKVTFWKISDLRRIKWNHINFCIDFNSLTQILHNYWLHSSTFFTSVGAVVLPWTCGFWKGIIHGANWHFEKHFNFMSFNFSCEWAIHVLGPMKLFYLTKFLFLSEWITLDFEIISKLKNSFGKAFSWSIFDIARMLVLVMPLKRSTFYNFCPVLS